MMIGGLLGDFVKGPLTGQYPRQVEQGIVLHRRIDAWVDEQPEVRQAISRFQPPWRRFGGIFVDICYDHFLATSWQHYHSQPLPEYAAQFYRQLQRHYAWLPEGARRFADHAPQVALLENYVGTDAIANALIRIGKRLRQPIALENAYPLLQQDLTTLRQEFEQMFPRLQQFAQHQRARF